IPGVPAGLGLLAELDALRAAGFSNFDALAAATSNAGTFVGKYRPGLRAFGEIKVGARPDFLLLDSDPRTDFESLRRPVRVMAAGQWVATREDARPQPPKQMSSDEVASDLRYFRDVYAPKERAYTDQTRAAMVRFIEGQLATARPMTRAEIALIFSEAQALSGNNHTQSEFFDTESEFHPLPISFWWFTEGAVITRVHPGFEALLGARILSIGGVPIAEAERRVAKYISGNAVHHKDLSPSWLRRLEVLQSIGLAGETGTTITVITKSRKRETWPMGASPTREPAVLTESWRESVVPGKGPRPWPQATDGLRPLPPYLQPPTDLTHLYLDGGDLLYLRSSNIYNVDDSNPFSGKAYNIIQEALYRPKPPTDVALDIRFNSGGDFLKIVSLSRELVELTKPGGFIYVITGRTTNSAAILFTALLQAAAPERTRIVGEPISDAEHFWSEGGLVETPAGLSLRYTDGYHDWANGCRDRQRCYWPQLFDGVGAGPLRVQMPVHFTFKDYASGRDAALEAIKADRAKRKRTAVP
ncbi:MAG: hypothetical protein ABIN83_02390, partial [Sphingomicrobium sp.]